MCIRSVLSIWSAEQRKLSFSLRQRRGTRTPHENEQAIEIPLAIVHLSIYWSPACFAGARRDPIGHPYSGSQSARPRSQRDKFRAPQSRPGKNGLRESRAHFNTPGKVEQTRGHNQVREKEVSIPEVVALCKKRRSNFCGDQTQSRFVDESVQIGSAVDKTFTDSSQNCISSHLNRLSSALSAC